MESVGTWLLQPCVAASRKPQEIVSQMYSWSGRPLARRVRELDPCFCRCVFAQSFVTLRLRPPLERSTARETRSRTRSVFLTICVLSELHDFATETTSAAVARSRHVLTLTGTTSRCSCYHSQLIPIVMLHLLYMIACDGTRKRAAFNRSQTKNKCNWTTSFQRKCTSRRGQK